MVLKNLQLTDFRNYNSLKVEFTDNTTLLVGDNTQGKTNLLEAVFMIATSKSFRAENEDEVIRFEKELARIEGIIENKTGKNTLELILTKGILYGKRVATKKVKVNGVSRRVTDFIGNLNVILFSPQDIELVTDSPSIRRKHLDFFLSQISSNYRRSLSEYGKALTQRNRLLEKILEGQAKREELSFWDNQLLEYGKVLTDQRHILFDFLNEKRTQAYDFSFNYQPSLISKEVLENNLEREILASATLHGPHRDDFSFFLSDKNLTFYGSRGEQREAVFTLKLLELEYMTQATGERPILLLDDIFSEFDHHKREKILSLIPKQQTFITTTDFHLIPQKYQKKVDVFLVEKGNLKNLKK